MEKRAYQFENKYFQLRVQACPDGKVGPDRLLSRRPRRVYADLDYSYQMSMRFGKAEERSERFALEEHRLDEGAGLLELRLIGRADLSRFAGYVGIQQVFRIPEGKPRGMEKLIQRGKPYFEEEIILENRSAEVAHLLDLNFGMRKVLLTSSKGTWDPCMRHSLLIGVPFRKRPDGGANGVLLLGSPQRTWFWLTSPFRRLDLDGR